MLPGFHCSNLEFHDPLVLIPRLSQAGFGAIAIRPCRGAWDDRLSCFESRQTELAAVAKEHDVAVVMDLDSPFYDDPPTRHPFSIASASDGMREQAVEKIRRWIEITCPLGPQVITFSTGLESDETSNSTSASGLTAAGDCERLLERLADAMGPLIEHAISAGTQLALRPVSGHAIATVAQFERFGHWIGSHTPLGLAADVGEMLTGGEFPIGARLARLGQRLACVYLCEPDTERGGDQRFGRGDIDFARVYDVITQSGFTGPGIMRAIGYRELGFHLIDEARDQLGRRGK